MVLHVFISFLGGVPLCIPYGLYSGTSLGGTTREILGGFPGRVLSLVVTPSLLSRVIESQEQNTKILSIRDRVRSDTGDKG